MKKATWQAVIKASVKSCGELAISGWSSVTFTECSQEIKCCICWAESRCFNCMPAFPAACWRQGGCFVCLCNHDNLNTSPCNRDLHAVCVCMSMSVSAKKNMDNVRGIIIQNWDCFQTVLVNEPQRKSPNCRTITLAFCYGVFMAECGEHSAMFLSGKKRRFYQCDWEGLSLARNLHLGHYPFLLLGCLMVRKMLQCFSNQSLKQRKIEGFSLFCCLLQGFLFQARCLVINQPRVLFARTRNMELFLGGRENVWSVVIESLGTAINTAFWIINTLLLLPQ